MAAKATKNRPLAWDIREYCKNTKNNNYGDSTMTAKDVDEYVTAAAISLLKQGKEISFIIQVTGLSLERIQKLKTITSKRH